MSGFLRLVKATLLVFHPLIALVSIVIALPLIILIWGIWVGDLIVRLLSRTSRPVATPPQIDGAHSDVSVDQLLGANPSRQIDAVFEGGGVKAIAQVGAVKAAERLGLNWSLLGGTSGGAIVSSLLAAGKDSQQIWQILAGTGLHSVVNVWYLPDIPRFQRKLYFIMPLLPHLLLTKGLVSGREFLKIMRHHLQKDGHQLLFKDVRNPERDQDSTAPLYRLKMVATDVSRGTSIVLPDDLPYYWEPWERARRVLNVTRADAGKLTPEDAKDHWPVAEGVRMSMSIPFFFNPFALHLNIDPIEGKHTNRTMGARGKKVSIVDGGVSSNFPIWLYDTLNRTPTWPTFGFLLDENKATSGQLILSIGNLIDMAVSVVTTGLGAMDERLNDHDEYRTARLRTLRVNTTDFGLSPEKQEELYESGYRDAVDFFRRFDWGEYLRRFRR